MVRVLRCVLVVEDETRLRQGVCAAARAWAQRVIGAASVAEARRGLLEGPDLILLDVRLPDGSGEDVARAASYLVPRPLIVAMSGMASAEEAFRLARLGVGAYLPKPVMPQELRAAVQRLQEGSPDLQATARAALGHLTVDEAQRRLRSAMVHEAMDRSDGNKSGAARILGVSRQAVQRRLREEPADEEE